MQFESSYSEYDCTGVTEPDGAVHLPNGCDSSHLVGSPVKQFYERFDATQFDALLTDYDRMLLRLGMHIAW
jgi:hypothetical protein